MSLTTPNPDPWKPDAERLAAYCDGEITDHAEAARIEAYLAEHPEAQAEVAAQRRLKQLWDQTTPAGPSTAAWQRVLDGLDEPRPLIRPHRPNVAIPALVVLALAACIAWAWLLAGTYRPEPVPPVAALSVASDDDVEILHIDGEDITSIVVGRLPLLGVMELADPGEVDITKLEAAPGDRMMPTVHAQGERPMIWAPLENEE